MMDIRGYRSMAGLILAENNHGWPADFSAQPRQIVDRKPYSSTWTTVPSGGIKSSPWAAAMAGVIAGKHFVEILKGDLSCSGENEAGDIMAKPP